jgi:hypothetical protein
MVDPAKRGLERTRIELEMLDFRPGAERAFQLTARIDRIDRDFLFWNARHPCSRPGVQPLPLAFGGHTGKQGLGPSIY